MAQEVLRTDFTVVPPKPELLTQEQLLRVLEMQDLISSWLKDVAAHAQKLLESGESLPGWKLVQKKSNRKWKDEKEAITQLLKWEKVLGIFEKALKSPAKIEKALKTKGLQDQIDLAALVEKPDTGLTIAPASDRRPAAAPKLPQFEAIPEEW